MLLLVLFVFAACSEPVITPVRDEVLFRQQSFPDLVFVNFDAEDLVLLGSASGFPETRVLDPTVYQSQNVSTGDTNGDGVDDIIIGSSNNHLSYVAGFDGAFSLVNAPTSVDSYDSRLADMDGDGDLDAVFAGVGPTNVYVNPGDGQLTGGTGWSNTMTNTFGLAVGDLNGNGLPDIVHADNNNGLGSGLRWLENVGGSFDPEVDIQAPLQFFEDVAVGDMDNDGDVDIITARGGDPALLFINNGPATFNVSPETIDSSNPTAFAVELGDLNNDGFVDIVFATSTINRRVMNNGDGTFDGGANIGSMSASSQDLALADFNLDGNLDVAFANSGTSNVVHYGNGDGSFAAKVIVDTSTSTTNGVAVGNFD